MINVNHKTAWLMNHKIMQVMVNAEKSHKISGRIEMDDAYLGGKKKGGKKGRGAEGKQPFIAAIETTPKPEKHPHFAKLSPVEAFCCSEIEKWTNHNIREGSHIVSDALACFKGVESICSHEVHICKNLTEEEKEKHFGWVNTILSNVKTGLTGTFHSFECLKYSFRYLGAIMYRFNRRFYLDQIFLTLVHDCAKSPPVPMNQVQL